MTTRLHVFVRDDNHVHIWHEQDHPRGQRVNAGQFARKGAAAVGGAVKRAVGYGVGKAAHFTEHDHRILSQQLHRPNSSARRTLAQHVVGISKMLPRMISGHLREEKAKAVDAVGALKALSAGQRPTPQQLRGLRSFGVRVLMSAGSMAISGDVTGTVPHIAMKLGEEIVNHVIGEHTLQAGASMARLAIPKRFRGQQQAAAHVGDADVVMSPEDIELLRKFTVQLAKATRELDIPDARVKELLARGNKP